MWSVCSSRSSLTPSVSMMFVTRCASTPGRSRPSAARRRPVAMDCPRPIGIVPRCCLPGSFGKHSNISALFHPPSVAGAAANGSCPGSKPPSTLWTPPPSNGSPRHWTGPNIGDARLPPNVICVWICTASCPASSSLTPPVTTTPMESGEQRGRPATGRKRIINRWNEIVFSQLD